MEAIAERAQLATCKWSLVKCIEGRSLLLGIDKRTGSLASQEKGITSQQALDYRALVCT